MNTLVLTHLPADLEAALRAEQSRSGRSLEQVAVDLLQTALGLKRAPSGHSNGLRDLAGSWSAEDKKQFDEAVAPFAKIDPDLWR